MSKKPCKNDTMCEYSGKESSPLGLGYSARPEQVGTIMEGRDKTMWMVGMKNGVHVWNRVPTEVAAIAAPLKKEEPVIAEAAPQAKKAAPKKVVAKKPLKTATEDAPKEVEEEKPTVEEVPAEEKAASPKKKKAPVVKKEEQPAKPDEVEPAAPAKKKPTSFNLFMRFRLKTLSAEQPGLENKVKFGMVATEWKNMTAEEKAAFVSKITENNEQ